MVKEGKRGGGKVEEGEGQANPRGFPLECVSESLKVGISTSDDGMAELERRDVGLAKGSNGDDPCSISRSVTNYMTEIDDTPFLAAHLFGRWSGRDPADRRLRSTDRPI